MKDTGLIRKLSRGLSVMVKPAKDPTLERAATLFRDAFKEEPQVAAFAPGRVNLIGEHTDYNEGFVFPLALELRTFVVGRGSLLVLPPNAKTPLMECRIISDADSSDNKGVVSFVADKTLFPSEPKWANYVKGVLSEYLKDVPQGKYLCFEAAISSNVPLGSGLSSSASLEVAFATFIEQIIGSAPKPKEKALRCQSAEHKFAKVPCGIMDQAVSTLGKEGRILLLDCRDHSERLVPLNDRNLIIMIANTNVKHALGDSQYPVRVKQCKAAVQALSKKFPGVTSLRGVTMEQLDAVKATLDPVDYRRARHVIGEDKRTLSAVEALEQRRYEEVGKLMVESHNSLRDDYEVSCTELDFLVATAMTVPGVLGSRMTGGGFGGCTVTLVQKSAVEALEKALKSAYKAKFNKETTIFLTTPGQGAGTVALQTKEEKDRNTMLLVVLGLAAATVAGAVLFRLAKRRNT